MVDNKSHLFLAGYELIATHNTTLAIEEMIGWAVTKKDRRIAYFANTYAQARDIVWVELTGRLSGVAVKTNESRLEITVPTRDGGTSIIQLRGWENVDTARGQKFHFIVLDEVASMRNFWENWSEVLRPAITDTKGHAMFISTPKGFNHFYDLYNKHFEAESDDFASYHFTSYDNPYLDPEEIDKAKLEMTEDRFHQEYMADFRRQEGLVYKEFNRTHNIYSEEIEIKAPIKMSGVDFGFVNPCAVITVTKDYDNTYYITDEWYHRGKTDAEIAEYVAAQGYAMVYPDPENAGGIEDMKRRGVNCRDVVKGKDSIENGINKIRELLKQRRLLVHSSCKHTIAEFETYHYDEDSRKETPVKENDHALDAIRYVIMMQEDKNTVTKVERILKNTRNRERKQKNFAR